MTSFFYFQILALTIPDLSEAIQQWEDSANRQLVTWIGHSQSWTDEIPSAVAFLCGAFPHAQPPGFNPIIISDTNSGLYQWCGSDQESDATLSQLASWWLERRSACRAITSENSEINVALREFQSQEYIRMLERPAENFVYQLENGDQKISVGPVQAPPETYFNDQQMQNLVNDSRVNFYTLIQDALGRLPNKKGSLDDISNLVRQSQFLQVNCESTTLLKKTALALTHFQKGILLPHVLFDPATRQYLILPPKPPAIPAPVQNNHQLPRQLPVNAGQSVVMQQRNGKFIYFCIYLAYLEY